MLKLWYVLLKFYVRPPQNSRQTPSISPHGTDFEGDLSQVTWTCCLEAFPISLISSPF